MPNNATIFNIPQNTQAQNAVVSFSTIALQVIVPAIASQTIRIQAIVLVAAAATTVTFQSDSTALSGAISLIAGTPLVCEVSPNVPWFVTATGQGFKINNTAAVQVSGWVIYTQS